MQQVVALAEMTQDVIDISAAFETLMVGILEADDRRGVLDVFREASGKSLTEAIGHLEQSQRRTLTLMRRFQDVNYYLDLELNKGDKGTWREHAKLGNKGMDYTVKAVVQLRKDFEGIGIAEAKNIVEAYSQGMFK